MTDQEGKELKETVQEALEGMTDQQQAAAWNFLQGMQAMQMIQQQGEKAAQKPA